MDQAFALELPKSDYVAHNVVGAVHKSARVWTIRVGISIGSSRSFIGATGARAY